MKAVAAKQDTHDKCALNKAVFKMSLTAQPNNNHGNNTKGQLREQLMYNSYNIQ